MHRRRSLEFYPGDDARRRPRPWAIRSFEPIGMRDVKNLDREGSKPNQINVLNGILENRPTLPQGFCKPLYGMAFKNLSEGKKSQAAAGWRGFLTSYLSI